jgi:hypothetical protein
LDSIGENVLTVTDSAGDAAQLMVKDGEGATLAEIYALAIGSDGSSNVALRRGGNANVELSSGDGWGQVSASDQVDQSLHFIAQDGIDLAIFRGGGANRLRVSPNGYLVVMVTAAPADAELAAGQVALWFDATNGAAKLMIKGKSANGTVVTGEVALT